MILRYARPEDLDSICRVWQSSFGDSEKFIRTFFDRTGIIATTAVAELDGQICSLMCAFDGIGDMSYLYALCTAPEYRGRGIGSEVLRETIRLARCRGASTVALHPADNELAKWYSDNFSLSPTGYFAHEQFTASDTPLAAEEVSFSKLLAADSSVTAQLCAAQEVLAQFYGGHLLKVGSSLVYVEERSGEVTVKAIPQIIPETEQSEVFSAIAKYFGVPSISVRKYFINKPVILRTHYVNLACNCTAPNETSIIPYYGFQYVLD